MVLYIIKLDELIELLKDGTVMERIWKELMGKELIYINDNDNDKENEFYKLDSFYKTAIQFGIKECRLISSKDIISNNFSKIYSCFRYFKTLKNVQDQRKDVNNNSIYNIMNQSICIIIIFIASTALKIQQENNYLVEQLSKKVDKLEYQNKKLIDENNKLKLLENLKEENEELKCRIKEIEKKENEKYIKLEKERDLLFEKYMYNINMNSTLKNTPKIDKNTSSSLQSKINDLSNNLSDIKSEIKEKSLEMNKYTITIENEFVGIINKLNSELKNKKERIIKEINKSKIVYNNINSIIINYKN